MGGPFLQLPHDGTALFAYGSLFCRGSLEQTLGRPYPLPLVVCRLRGWRRVWDVAMPNRTFFSDTSTGRLYPAGILYLNIDRRAASWVNGVLIVAGAAELELLDHYFPGGRPTASGKHLKWNKLFIRVKPATDHLQAGAE